MILRNLLLLFACYISPIVSGQTLKVNNLTNPTGTYKTHFDNPKGKALPEGTIKVKLIRQNRMVVSIIMQNGEPLLRSGSLTDTLTYKSHYAIFENAEIDSTCKITFHFTTKGIRVKQTSKFTNYSCDFADGVSMAGFYFKESAKVPDFHSPY